MIASVDRRLAARAGAASSAPSRVDRARRGRSARRRARRSSRLRGAGGFRRCRPATAFRNARSLRAAAAVAASASQRSPRAMPPTQRVGERRRRRRRRRLIGQAEQRRQPHLRRPGRSSSPAARIAPADRASRGSTCTALRRTPAEGCVRAHGRRSGRPRSSRRKRPRPCSVQSAWIAAGVQADRVDRLCSLDQSSTSVRARRRVLPRSTSSRWACSRQNRLSFCKRGDQRLGGVGRVESRRPCRLGVLGDERDRSGRASCRAAGSRRRCPCRSGSRGAWGCAGRCSCTSRSPRRCRRGRPRPGSARSTRRRWPAGSSRSVDGSRSPCGASVNVATRWPVGSVTNAVRFQYCCG